ncbi:hypothetical protein AB0C52_12485 [Streptomyces sp. NPDC048717]|uniref:hypothetical protein n=1 Tax=Streptomyces sp. NPDC048717 TaxID=3154928 RepID=UPI00343D5195
MKRFGRSMGVRMVVHVVASETAASGGGVDVVSLIAFLLFGIFGVAMLLNIRGAADEFFRLVSFLMFGKVGFATVGTLRVVGGVIAVLSIVNLAARIGPLFI